jgi:hypothetical protein
MEKSHSIADDFVRHDVTHFDEGENKIEASVPCRTVRVGSYKFDCKDKVMEST